MAALLDVAVLSLPGVSRASGESAFRVFGNGDHAVAAGCRATPGARKAAMLYPAWPRWSMWHFFSQAAACLLAGAVFRRGL